MPSKTVSFFRFFISLSALAFAAQVGVANTIELFAADGQLLAGNLSPEGFCGGLRQLIEAARTCQEIDGLAQHNARPIEALRERAPALRNSRGEHYADIVLRLLERRHENLRPKEVTDGQRAVANDVGLPSSGEILVTSLIRPMAIDADAANEEFLAANTTADQPANGAVVEPGTSDAPTTKPAGHGRLIVRHDAQLPPANGKSRPLLAPSSRKTKRLPASPSKIGDGDRIDKSALRFGYGCRSKSGMATGTGI